MPKQKAYPNIERSNPRDCYARKILKSSRIITSIFRKHISPFDITYSQVSILFIVAKKRVVTQNQLSKDLYLEKSTVSRNMRRLFDHEFLVKENRNDILITKKGKSLLEQIIPEWEKAMEEARILLRDEGEEALDIILSQLTS